MRDLRRRYVVGRDEELDGNLRPRTCGGEVHGDIHADSLFRGLGVPPMQFHGCPLARLARTRGGEIRERDVHRGTAGAAILAETLAYPWHDLSLLQCSLSAGEHVICRVGRVHCGRFSESPGARIKQSNKCRARTPRRPLCVNMGIHRRMYKSMSDLDALFVCLFVACLWTLRNLLPPTLSLKSCRPSTHFPAKHKVVKSYSVTS